VLGAPPATLLSVVFGPPVAVPGLGAGLALAVLLYARLGAPSSWMVMGALYAALPVLCLEILRGTSDTGLIAIMWILALVWAADTAAYLAGKLIGGAKLAPRLSPSKTWSGAIAAFVAAGLVGFLTASWIGNTSTLSLTAVSLLLGVVVVLGDLAESGLKRHFGVKDTGKLIPGHGGVMDRVDGLLAVAVVAAAIGYLRGGLEHPARGLLIW